MKRKKRNIIIILIVVALLIFVYFWHFRLMQGNYNKTISINKQKFSVEIVQQESDLEKGLGDRTNMCSSCGMLFEFARAGKYAFWMKGMQFSLDILWIHEDQVVQIKKHISPDYLETLEPTEIADKVLEINAGTVDKYGIKVGDTIQY